MREIALGVKYVNGMDANKIIIGIIEREYFVH